MWAMWDQWDRWEDGPMPATNDDKETDAQRSARLEREIAGLHDMVHALHRDFVQVVERLPVLQDRATTAEETVAVMREHVRTLWETVYKGKITRMEDVLRGLERIIHA